MKSRMEEKGDPSISAVSYGAQISETGKNDDFYPLCWIFFATGPDGIKQSRRIVRMISSEDINIFQGKRFCISWWQSL